MAMSTERGGNMEMQNETVKLETYASNVFGIRWALARMDGKTEATGFRSPGEAVQWATDHGYILNSDVDQ